MDYPVCMFFSSLNQLRPEQLQQRSLTCTHANTHTQKQKNTHTQKRELMGLQLMMKVYAHTFLKWGVLKSIYNTRSLADLYVLLAVRLLRSSVTVSLTHNNFHALSSPRFYTTHSQLRTHTTINKNGREHGQLLGLLLFFYFFTFPSPLCFAQFSNATHKNLTVISNF